MKCFRMILFFGVLCSFAAVATIGCEKDTAEKVGEKMEDVVDSAKDAVDK